MADSVKVSYLPHCNFCNTEDRIPADYDGKTIFGPWAHMCEKHFRAYGIGLGTGKGQRLILEVHIDSKG